MEETQFAKGYFSSSTIKVIAILSMLVDHTGAVLVDPITQRQLYLIMRNVGRLAFPIFCFLIVQGFLHTHDVKKYALRLLVFAFLSEVPFDLAFGLKMEHQNVFFTLFLGLVVLIVLDRFSQKIHIQILSVAIGCILAYYLRTDYSYMGILLIVFLYYYRGNRKHRILSVIMVNFFMLQPVAALSLVFTEYYNGKRGFSLKYFFYLFYPVHLLMLYLISLQIN